MAEPGSELATYDWLTERSDLGELLGVPSWGTTYYLKTNELTWNEKILQFTFFQMKP